MKPCVSTKMHFFEKKLQKNLVMSKKSSTFAPAFEKEVPGAVVQLVRIPACHAVGREFESRPHRQTSVSWFSFQKQRGMPLPAEAGFPD